MIGSIYYELVNGVLVPRYPVQKIMAKVFVGVPGTMIPNSTGSGTYNTKLKFQSQAYDTLGTIVDLVNHRFNIPSSGYRYCRLTYNLAWGLQTWTGNTSYAVNDTVVPTTANGFEYQATAITTGISAAGEPTWPVVAGNTVVDGGVTWTARAIADASGWRGCRVKNSAGSNYGNVRIPSVGTGVTTNNNYISPWIPISTNTAPDTILAGDYFSFYPAQTHGYSMTCGADTASSFVAIELAP